MKAGSIVFYFFFVVSPLGVYCLLKRADVVGSDLAISHQRVKSYIKALFDQRLSKKCAHSCTILQFSQPFFKTRKQRWEESTKAMHRGTQEPLNGDVVT